MQITGNDVLIVIDVQNDFCPGGALAVADGDGVIDPIHNLAVKFDHIVLTQDWHTPGHSSFASAHAGKKAVRAD
jgi:nicotinamidase/pyrazinamidase